MIETGNFWWLVIVLSVAAFLCFSTALDSVEAKRIGISVKPYMLAGAIAAFLALYVALGILWG